MTVELVDSFARRNYGLVGEKRPDIFDLGAEQAITILYNNAISESVWEFVLYVFIIFFNSIPSLVQTLKKFLVALNTHTQENMFFKN